MYKDIFEELALKFSHLGELKPDHIKTRLNIFDNVLSENFVHNLNPNRYAFYMQFMKGLSNPNILKSLIYETKLIKIEKEEEAKLINDIVSKINQLYNLNMTTGLIGDDNMYVEQKKKLIENENKRLNSRLVRILANEGITNNSKTINEIKETFKADIISDASAASHGGGKKGGAGNQEEFKEFDIIADDVATIGQQNTMYNDEPSLLGNNESIQQALPNEYDQRYISNQVNDAGQQSIPVVQTQKPVIEQEQFSIPQKPMAEVYLPTPNSDDVTKNKQETYAKYISNYKNIEKNIADATTKLNESDVTIEELNSLKKKLEEDYKYLNDTHFDSIIESLQRDNIQLPDTLQKQNQDSITKINDKITELKKKQMNEEFKETAYQEINKLVLENKENLKKAKNQNEDELKKRKENFKSMKDGFLKRSLLHSYEDSLRKILKTDTTNAKLKAEKLKDVIDDIENNKAVSIDSLKLTKEDKLVFIGICFIIRLVTLGMIDWALNTNYIVSFTHAYILYVILYCIFILVIICIVNITFRYPIYQLYNGNHGIFTSIASVLYFFYMIPDYVLSSSIRFLVHFGIIIFLTFIALLIQVNQQDNEQLLAYNYTEKKKIRQTLGNFTLLLWFFTSVIAMYMF